MKGITRPPTRGQLVAQAQTASKIAGFYNADWLQNVMAYSSVTYPATGHEHKFCGCVYSAAPGSATGVHFVQSDCVSVGPDQAIVATSNYSSWESYSASLNGNIPATEPQSNADTITLMDARTSPDNYASLHLVNVDGTLNATAFAELRYGLAGNTRGMINGDLGANDSTPDPSRAGGELWTATGGREGVRGAPGENDSLVKGGEYAQACAAGSTVVGWATDALAIPWDWTGIPETAGPVAGCGLGMIANAVGLGDWVGAASDSTGG